MRRFNRGVAWYTEIMYSSRVQYSSYSADPDRPSADEMAAVHRRMNPPVKVVVFSAMSEPEVTEALVAAGASTFVSKLASADLPASIRRVCADPG